MSNKNAASSAPSPPEWLLLGVEGSGKSLVLRSLKRLEKLLVLQQQQKQSVVEDVDAATEPTNGMERETLVVAGQTIVVKEIGGSLKTTWSSYYSNCAGIMFVIDVSSSSSLSSAVFELATLLTQSQLSQTNFIIMLNKIDVSGALSRTELQASARLDDWVQSASSSSGNRSVSVIETSALKSTGLSEVLQLVFKTAQR